MMIVITSYATFDYKFFLQKSLTEFWILVVRLNRAALYISNIYPLEHMAGLLEAWYLILIKQFLFAKF